MSSNEEKEELRQRLLRGGLPPEAVEKALDAHQAGAIRSLPFTVSNNTAFCIVPEALIRTVFQVPTAIASKELKGMHLDFEINRHRGGRRSLTLIWPETQASESDEASTEQEAEAPLRPPTLEFAKPTTESASAR